MCTDLHDVGTTSFILPGLSQDHVRHYSSFASACFEIFVGDAPSPASIPCVTAILMIPLPNMITPRSISL
jgi:hypothetical protein